ncbi:FRG domain-containing protein [Methylomonas sp. TEB]|uniref:FRG domain-containing protein n=1 Tax=Methylomonas sp. TEB TaxID=3398229 RepID=UPI0039F519B0
MTEQTLEHFWQEFFALPHISPGGPDSIFRGVTDLNHQLIPSIGRNTKENTYGDIETLEEDILNEFKRLTVPLLKNPPKSEFEWLFLAQHYGLPTRLLDWSSNPLVALFFATERNDNKDGCIYYLKHAVTDQYDLFDYKTVTYTKEQAATPVGIFSIQPHQGNFIFVRPRYTDERYINQKSVFSCPKDPFNPLNISDIKTITIKSFWKPEIRCRLRMLGISTSFIYPGLAGIAAEIKSHQFNPVANGHMQIMTLRAELKLS